MFAERIIRSDVAQAARAALSFGAQQSPVLLPGGRGSARGTVRRDGESQEITVKT